MPRTVFLSHSGADTAEASLLRERLLANFRVTGVACDIWFDKADLKPGKGHWQGQIEQAIAQADAFMVYIGAQGVVNWVENEVRIGLSRATADKIPFIPVLSPKSQGSRSLPAFARIFQAVRDPLRDATAFNDLVDAILAAARPTGERIDDPFPGLRSMDEGDAQLFFGREHETNQLVDILHHERLVAIVSDSGAGKSSLAKAGLVPRFRGGAFAAESVSPGADRIWHVVEMRPGTDPMRGLRMGVDAAAMALGLDGDARAGLRGRVQPGDVEELVHALACDLPVRSTELLLIVDQAEDLVTQCSSEHATAFLDLLDAITRPGPFRVRVVLTVRADYFNLLSLHSDFFDRLTASPDKTLLRLPQLDDGGLQRVVTEPLRFAGYPDHEDALALAAAIHRDTLGRPGDTALIQFALWTVWNRRTHAQSLIEAYSECGGIFGALAHEADRVRSGLSPKDEALLLPIFVRLVRPGDTGGATARVAALNEFGEDQRRLVGRLAGDLDEGIEVPARLLLTDDKSVQIAHEALIRQWPWLQVELNKRKDDIRLLGDLMQDSERWIAEGQLQSRLAQEAKLRDFERLADQHAVWLSSEEAAFIEAARGLRTSQEEIAAAQRQREQDAKDEAIRNDILSRKWFKIAALVAFLAVGLALVAGVSSYSALQNASAAEQKSAEALLNQRMSLSALSEAERRAGRPVEAAFLALAAWPRRAEPGTDLARLVRARINLSNALVAMKERLRLSGHENGVTSVAFSPDGQLLATGSWDNTVRVWDMATGSEVLRLEGHEEAVTSVAFSPNGQRLSSGSWDNSARVWDLATRSEILRLEGHEGLVTSIAFSPDGQHLATGSGDHTAGVWDLTTGSQVMRLVGHESNVNSVAFSPDGQRVATGSSDNTARIWDIATAAEVMRLKGHQSDVTTLAFSPDGQRLATGSYDATVRIWNLTTDSEILWSVENLDWIESVAFSPDGQRLAAASRDSTAWVWDLAKGSESLQLVGHQRDLTSVAFSPDGRRLATGSNDGTARVWDLFTGFEVLRLEGHEAEVESVDFSPDGQRLATGSYDNIALVWDLATGLEVLRLEGHEAEVESVAFSPDGQRLATGSLDRTARVWDLATGSEVLRLEGHEAEVESVAFSPDGQRLATGSWDRTARVWDLATGSEVLRLAGHEAAVRGVDFSPDGLRLASGSNDGTARVWDLATGSEVLRLAEHEAEVISISFSPDGQHLATGSNDDTARVWDLATGSEISRLEGHAGYVSSVAFSPNGQYLATGSWDNTTRVWDLATGSEVLRTAIQEGLLASVAFSPDGQNLATGSWDGTARVWNVTLPPGNLFAVACALLPTRDPPAALTTYGIDIGEPICSGTEPLLPTLPMETKP